MRLPAKLGLLLACGAAAQAQLVVSARAGLINYFDGTVYLDTERLTSSRLHSMKADQILHTAKGQAEVLLAPAIVLRLAAESSFWLEDTRLNDVQVTIEKGSALIEVIAMVKDTRLRVRLGETVTEFRHTGLYRFDAPPARLRVYGGEAETSRDAVKVSDSLKVSAKRGQAVDLSPLLAVSDFDRTSSDSFHTWSARRSFVLYNSTAENRRQQKHWAYIGDGWVRNENFNAKYRSWQARNDNSWAELQLKRGPDVKAGDSPRRQSSQPRPGPNDTSAPEPATSTPSPHAQGEPGGRDRAP